MNWSYMAEGDLLHIHHCALTIGLAYQVYVSEDGQLCLQEEFAENMKQAKAKPAKLDIASKAEKGPSVAKRGGKAKDETDDFGFGDSDSDFPIISKEKKKPTRGRNLLLLIITPSFESIMYMRTRHLGSMYSALKSSLPLLLTISSIAPKETLLYELGRFDIYMFDAVM